MYEKIGEKLFICIKFLPLYPRTMSQVRERERERVREWERENRKVRDNGNFHV